VKEKRKQAAEECRIAVVIEVKVAESKSVMKGRGGGFYPFSIKVSCGVV
jgi:hypothetical protein